MLELRLSRLLNLAIGLTLAFSSSPARAATPATATDRSPDALQARLDESEKNYKMGKVDVAVEQATSLVNVTDSSFFQSDRVARDAKADLAVFQLKAGNSDQTARWIRILLLNLQLELPMDPKYSTNTAEVLSQSAETLKDYFSAVIKRLDEKADTKAIVDSIVNNTVPKNYAEQLKSYCQRMQNAIDESRDLQSIADTEELRYGDSLSSLDEPDSQNKSDPKLGAARLQKLGKTLDALALQAQQMPVGDMRASLGLYKLALVANSAQRYEQAEMFANQSIAHAKAVMEASPNLPQVRIALAYALLKQGKKTEFKVLTADLLKGTEDRERLLVTLARFTEINGDDAGASAIYKQALENRTKHGNMQPPEWMDAYNTLLKKTGTQ